jgi:hypothetical protein
MQNGGAESDSPTKVWSLTAKLVISLATSRILVRKSKKKIKQHKAGSKYQMHLQVQSKMPFDDTLLYRIFRFSFRKNAPTTVVKMNERMETAIWERQPAQAFFPPTNQHKFEPETFRQLQDR